MAQELRGVLSDCDTPVSERVHRLQRGHPRDSATQTTPNDFIRARQRDQSNSRIPRPVKRGQSPGHSPVRSSKLPRPVPDQNPRPTGSARGRRRLPDISRHRAARQDQGIQTPSRRHRVSRPGSGHSDTGRRKLPKVHKKQCLEGAAALALADSDTESGYGETIYTLSARDALSQDQDVHSQSGASGVEPSIQTLSYAWTQTSPRQGIASLSVAQRSNSVPNIGNSSAPGASGAEPPRSRGVSFGENSEFTLSSQSSQASSLDSSQDDVLRAVLEADRNMQEMMREHTDPFESHHASDTWQIKEGEVGDGAANGTPVPVVVMPDGAEDFRVQTKDNDSLSRASPQHPHSGMSSPRLALQGAGDPGSMASMESVFDHTDQEVWQEDQPDGRSSQVIRDTREVRVVEQQTSLTKHVSVKRPQDIAAAGAAAAMTDTGIQDDAASWMSGDTEPEPELPVETADFATQTPRHRSTQTPGYAATQTPKFYRRRRLPQVPGTQNTIDDLVSEDGAYSLVSLDSVDVVLSPDEVTESGRTAATQTKHKAVAGRGKHSLPTAYPWKSQTSLASSAEEEGEEDVEQPENDVTNQRLMQTMPFRGTGSMRQTSPERQISPDRESTLRRTQGITQGPGYVDEYRKLIESYDGTASGPFVPGDFNGPLEDSVFIPNESPRRHPMTGTPRRPVKGHAQTMPHELSQPLDNMNIPRSTLRDHAGEASGSVRHDLPDDAYASSERTNQDPRRSRRQPGYPRHDQDSMVHFPQSARSDRDQWAAARTPQGQYPGGEGPYGDIGTDVLRSSPSLHRVQTRDTAIQTPGDTSTQTPLKGGAHNDIARRTLPLDSLAAWSVLGIDDAEKPFRDFSTQTFGQMAAMLQNNVETQTEPAVAASAHLNDQAATSVPVVTVPDINVTRQPAEKPDEETRSERNRSRRNSDAVVKSDSSKDKPKHRHRSKDRDNASVMTAGSNKKDILKFMLSQVKAMKSQLSPARSSPEHRSSSKPRHGERHRSKSRDKKHGGPGRESDSAFDSMVEDPDRYTRRRLELMYRSGRPDRTQGWLSDGEALARHRRRRPVEGYLSDRPDRYDPERARGLRSSRYGYSPDRESFRPSSGYMDTPRSRPRRAITPPPSGHLPEYDRGRRRYRELEPRRRHLPVPAGEPRGPNHYQGHHRQLPPPPPMHRGAPMPPQPVHNNLVQPGYGGPSAFQPVNPGMVPPPLYPPPQQPVSASPVMYMPASQPQPQYVVLVDQPAVEQMAVMSEPDVVPVRGPRGSQHRGLNESLNRAAKAANEMKVLTSKLQRRS